MNAKRVAINTMAAVACIVSLFLSSCSGFSAKSAEKATEVGDSIQVSVTQKTGHRVEKSQDPNSLEFWIPDKVFYANPHIVRTLNHLTNIFTELYCDCVDLNYWGGSIRGSIKGYGVNEIWKSHLELYRSEYSLINDAESASPVLYGTFIEPARNLLLDCCDKALTEYYQEGEDYGDLYEQTLKSAKKAVSKLSKAVDNWIAVREQWGDEVCHDWSRTTYPQNTAGVLVRLTNIISSIK